MQRAEHGLSKLPCADVHNHLLARLGACGEVLLARGQQLESASLQAVREGKAARFHPSVSIEQPARFAFEAQQAKGRK